MDTHEACIRQARPREQQPQPAAWRGRTASPEQVRSGRIAEQRRPALSSLAAHPP
jgi:hypothetical protein